MKVKFKPKSAWIGTLTVALGLPLGAMTSAPTPSLRAAMPAADDASNPYSVIVDRNIFRLQPIPPPPVVEEKPAELPKVYLNGIMKVGGDVRVLFTIPAKDAKSQPSYFKLSPGEKQDVLELVNIHPDQKEVDVLVSGTAETLSVLSNSMASLAPAGGKTPAVPAPPGVAPRGVAAADHSAIIVGGGGRESSSYGGVSVAGGNGGGNSPSYAAANAGGAFNPSQMVAAASGVGNSLSSGYSGGVSVGGGYSGAAGSALSDLGAGAGQSPGIARGLPVPTQIATPEQQAASAIIQGALGGPPPPPGLEPPGEK